MFYTPKGWRSVSMSTEFPSKNGIVRQWHVIDAQNVVLGQARQQGGDAVDGQA